MPVLAIFAAAAAAGGCSAGALEDETSSAAQALDNDNDPDDPGDNVPTGGGFPEEDYDNDQVEVQYTGQDLQAIDGDEAAAVGAQGAMTYAPVSTEIRVRGQIVCTYRQPADPTAYPLSYASIVAKDHNAYAIDPVLATGFTDASGSFEIAIPASKGDQPPDAPDIYLEVHYTDLHRRAAAGGPRRVYVSNDIDKVRKFNTARFDNVPRGRVLDISASGVLEAPDLDCILFKRAVDAYESFYGLTGTHHPAGSVRVHRWGGWGPTPGIDAVPWAGLVTVNYPNLPRGWVSNLVKPGYLPFSSNYLTSEETFFHEFAHTVRHTLDGNGAHFFGDVLKYRYGAHAACEVHSEGLAFNEGWADYWAHATAGESLYACSDPTDYRQENNVAVALRQLASCSGGPRSLVDVLRPAAGQIHSYRQFLDRWLQTYLSGVHRAWGNGEHFYSTSLAEASASPRTVEAANYFYLARTQRPGTAAFYRCNHPGQKHFYTTSSTCEGSGAINEGAMGFIATTPLSGTTPLYRLLQPLTGDHLYTTSSAERDSAIQQDGYLAEGIAGHVYVPPTSGQLTQCPF